MTLNFDTNWINSGDYGTIGNAINDYVMGNPSTDFTTIGEAAVNYSNGNGYGGFNLGNMPWGKIVNTLGKLGSGIGGFISAREASKMPTYIPTTQWLGNGLARIGYINNMQNKQNSLDQAAGATNAISSLFGKGYGIFGRGFGDDESLPVKYNSEYWNDYKRNPNDLSAIGYEIDRQVNKPYDYGNITY